MLGLWVEVGLGKMSNRIVFTVSALEQLPLPIVGARAVWHDTRAPGLQLRVTASGVKTFSWFRWVKGAGKPERMTLGRWPEMSIDDARDHVARLNAATADGACPATERREARAEQTFGDLFTLYLERWSKPRKRTWSHDLAYYQKHIAQALGSVRLSQITRREIADLHAKIGQAHPTMANRVLALVSSIMGRAREWGVWEGENPCLGVRRYPEQKRDRFLSGEEIQCFLAALEEEPKPLLRAFFLLSLLTGARRGNVTAMRWEEIDESRQAWRIPDTKNGQPVTVPLVPMAMEILGQLRQEAESEWVFPSPRSVTGHLVEPRKAWERVLARAGIEGARIHDLRRTMGSWQAITGASLPVIGKSLGHKSQQATAIYARLSLDPVREAMAKATEAMMGEREMKKR